MPPVDSVIKSAKEQARRLTDAALDLLFPPRCAVCGHPGDELCASCRAAFHTLTPPLCDICGLPLGKHTECPRCAQHRPSFHRVRSAYTYEGAVRKAIHALKYNHRPRLAGPLAGALVDVLSPPDNPQIVLCSVPMHPAREAERGYNHANLLARELAQHWGLAMLPPGALNRTRHTTTQVGLDRQTRQQNVQGAFEANRQMIEGYAVLLVDDVCTTGATMSACADVLYQAGCSRVEGVTLARTL